MPADIPVGQRGQHFDRINLELKGLDPAGMAVPLRSKLNTFPPFEY